MLKTYRSSRASALLKAARPQRRALQFTLIAALLCAGAAQAHENDCASGVSRSASCLDGFALPHEAHVGGRAVLVAARSEMPRVMAIRAQSLPAPFALDAASPAAPVDADFEVQAVTPQTGDLSMLGVLFAALGVLGFVAHRRSGR